MKTLDQIHNECGNLKIDCTPEQSTELEQRIAHIESFPNDDYMIRFVFTDGSKGRWFSRFWARIKYEQVV